MKERLRNIMKVTSMTYFSVIHMNSNWFISARGTDAVGESFKTLNEGAGIIPL
jgi:hypothetical protein